MTKRKALLAGLAAGVLAALAMTVAMLLLASLGIATPLAIIGDRLSVFIKPGPFLTLMGRVGGYNHLKQLGVGSTVAGQLLVGTLGGGVFGLMIRGREISRMTRITVAIFVLLPVVLLAVVLWPVLGTSYRGLPIYPARLVTLVGFVLSLVVFERTFVGVFRVLSGEPRQPNDPEFSPSIGRRALLISGSGLILAGGGVTLMRRLYRVATFSYDG